MPKGNPIYNYGDSVMFIAGENMPAGPDGYVHGFVAIVDSHGTFFDNSNASYDIMVPGDTDSTSILFKHISETYTIADDTEFAISEQDKNW